MSKKKEIEEKPYTERLTSSTSEKDEYAFFDGENKPVHKTKVVYKNKPVIIIYPYSHTRVHGLKAKKIKTLEFKGWAKEKDIPKDFKGKKLGNLSSRAKVLFDYIKRKFPDVTKITITKDEKSKFSSDSLIINWQELRSALLVVAREKEAYKIRNRAAIDNNFSQIAGKMSPKKEKLMPGALSDLLNLYDNAPILSEADIEALLPLLSVTPKNRVTITENYIKTKDKINFAYLEDVAEEYKKLLDAKNDNEKDWQTFFEKHGWVLNSLYPYQVILFKKEAYVGGKTIENEDGKVVDFLFHNGFEDNYALLEIKTHKKDLLKKTAYRGSNVFAMHDDLSGAISQCVDQKHTFLTSFGKEKKIFDPKALLIIGKKSDLNSNQKDCFELLRANQKNVEIVTFDELLQKLEGLLKILKA